MDKTLIDYEKNLEELEREKEKLQKVMQMMGQEWEESGPGIGWLGQVDLPNTQLTDESEQDTISTVTKSAVAPMTISNEPLFNNILSAQTGPSPEYLQSLLNVNEALLAESLADHTPGMSSASIATPIEEDLVTPLITPEEATTLKIQTDSYITPADFIRP